MYWLLPQDIDLLYTFQYLGVEIFVNLFLFCYMLFHKQKSRLLSGRYKALEQKR